MKIDGNSWTNGDSAASFLFFAVLRGARRSMEELVPSDSADAVAREKEKRILSLWGGQRSAAPVLVFAEPQFEELAESGVPLKMTVANAFHRMGAARLSLAACAFVDTFHSARSAVPGLLVLGL